jgi:hypothetical protein
MFDKCTKDLDVYMMCSLWQKFDIICGQVSYTLIIEPQSNPEGYE